MNQNKLLIEFKTLLKNERHLWKTLLVIREKNVEKLMISQHNQSNSPSIVIHAHIFHKNYLRRLKKLATNFPSALILVSVPDQNMEKYLIKKLQKNRKTQNIVITVAANQGRNFGPLINEFSDAVLKQDVLIHVHSKDAKGSIYRWMWSYLLWRELVLSASSIERNMRMISDERCGIIIPFSLRWMPHYFSWLGNFEFATVVFPKISRHSAPTAQLFYPIGGMFIARVEAIRPILDSHLLKKSFVPEELNEVGIREGITPEHMVERALGIIPTLLDFHALVLLVEKKNFYNSGHLLNVLVN